MNITLLTELWDGPGGIQSYMHGLAESLENVTIEHEKLRNRLTWPDWRGTYKRLREKQQAGELDAVICGKALFEGLVALKLKETTKTPYVIITHAMEIETWIKKAKTKKRLLKVLKNADVVIYINEVTKKTLLDLGVEEKQLLKLPAGVADIHFNNVSKHLVEATLQQYQVKQPYVLAVGRLVARKGFDVLIKSFAQLDQVKFGDHQLVIVGDGSALENLKTISEEEFINTSIKFLTNVPNKHMPALYQGAEVFAMTPRNIDGDMEGFGIVYMEAAAHGVPSVGTRSGGVPEAVLDDETGLLATEDSEIEIKDALEKILGNSELRNKLGTAAQSRAQKMTWANQAELLKTELGKSITD